MTSIIQGIEQLHHILSDQQIEKLQKAAERLAKESNITFTILSHSPEDIEIETIQGETRSGKYASEATLISRSIAMFEKHIPGISLKIDPVAFAPSVASTVTTAWIESKLQQKGIRIKQIAFDTGIDRESISDWVTGKRSMSQIVKAMFYFYLFR